MKTLNLKQLPRIKSPQAKKKDPLAIADRYNMAAPAAELQPLSDAIAEGVKRDARKTKKK
ncbi:MAG: hypothetical protein K2W95_15595 [Candidatus Obscuribacterales bacterium]|nr:hypothetical protein [Candidatus Obscuribacterales bacterium]